MPRRRTEYNDGIKEEESKGRWRQGGGEQRRMLTSRRRRAEKDAGVKEEEDAGIEEEEDAGIEEYDAGLPLLEPEEDDREGCWPLRRRRCWHPMRTME